MNKYRERGKVEKVKACEVSPNTPKDITYLILTNLREDS